MQIVVAVLAFGQSKMVMTFTIILKYHTFWHNSGSGLSGAGDTGKSGRGVFFAREIDKK